MDKDFLGFLALVVFYLIFVPALSIAIAAGFIWLAHLAKCGCGCW